MSANQPSPFFRLPRELRDMIYEYIFTPDPPAGIQPQDVFIGYSPTKSKSTIRPGVPNTLLISHFLPPLCLTSKQLSTEATPLFIKHTSFVLSDLESAKLLRNWLSTLSPAGFASITALNIALGGSRRDFLPATRCVADNWAFVASCPNITYLTLRLGSRPGEGGVEAAEERRWGVKLDMLQLERVLSLEKLRVLTFEVYWCGRAVENWVGRAARIRRRDVEVRVFVGGSRIYFWRAGEEG